MEKYEEPILEIVTFESTDILTDSTELPEE